VSVCSCLSGTHSFISQQKYYNDAIPYDKSAYSVAPEQKLQSGGNKKLKNVKKRICSDVSETVQRVGGVSMQKVGVLSKGLNELNYSFEMVASFHLSYTYP